jgi:peptidoglycan/xylan/chitin deacetylase (PgdA/CDA1 family)
MRSAGSAVPRPPARRVHWLLAAVLLTVWAGPALGSQCRGQVYLTFDPGNMAHAEEIAETLAAEQVRGTFFLSNERTVRGDRALDPAWGAFWRARVAEGHAFGNHTWSHHYLRRDLEDDRVLAASVEGATVTLDLKGFCADFGRVDEAFHRLTGQRLSGLWRAPGGRTTQQSVRWAASCGYPLHAGWDDAGFLGDDLPSDKHPNAELLRRALATIRAGDVLMMHLGVWQRREPLAGILKPLIQGLKARNLCFAPLGVATR